MHIKLLQHDIEWENAQENLATIDLLLSNSTGDPDLIVLPEMFTTGFSMNSPSLAETEDGPTVSWMKLKAASQQCCICGSLIIKDHGKYYNRFLAVDPTGIIARYNKRHLFRIGNEHLSYLPGDERVVFQTASWRIAPFICYDLRFPVWMRSKSDYDLILVIASWPAIRSEAWKCLLQARAIENQAYTIGVNRLGTDGRNIHYCGDSMVVDPRGNILFHADDTRFGLFDIELDMNVLRSHRNEFPAWEDADPFTLGG